MRILVYLPFLASAVLGVMGPWAAGRMPPKIGARLLLAAGATCAATSLISLALLAWTLVGQVPLVAAVGAWSGPTLRRYDPVLPVVAEAAGAMFVAVGTATLWSAVSRLRALRRTREAACRLGDGRRLVIVDQPEPEAFAVPARRTGDGRIVVSTGLLRVLDGAERRTVLAHENAHLRHRHHCHRLLAGLIAAANPLLLPIPGAINHLTERWADEEAAAVVADRRTAARALTRAALASHPPSGTSRRGDATLMCFHRDDIPGRVRALLAGAPPRRPLLALHLAALLAACLLSAGEAGRDAAQLLDQAGDHAHARPAGPEVILRGETPSARRPGSRPARIGGPTL
jgi:Zn-dependent protease with chaperone function